MENKEELEKLVEEEFSYLRRDVGKNNNEFLRHYIESVILTAKRVSALADKQGYMRCVEEALRVLPKSDNLGFIYKFFNTGNFNYKDFKEGFNSCLSQAHDAISKLKEKI